MDVRPARPHSVEDLFHDVGVPRFFLNLRDVGRAVDIDKPMLERAIGVIYRPQTELASHYYRCRIRQQFDAVIHFDHTRAVEPLDLVSLLQPGHLPSTAPTGM
jgi:erythromycin esterase-like protein